MKSFRQFLYYRYFTLYLLSLSIHVIKSSILTAIMSLQLRQSQEYCTDGECLDEPSLPRPESAANGFLTMFLMMALAVLMYAMRPRRTQIDEPAKPSAANFQVKSHHTTYCYKLNLRI